MAIVARAVVLAIGVALLSSAAAGACAESRSTADAEDAAAPSFGGAPVTFPEDASLPVQARYVLGGCAGGPESGCHAAGTSSAGLTLPDTQPSNLIDVASTEEPMLARVKPGDPARSYLFLKITGAPGIDGGRMPKDLAPLDGRSISAIHAWIEAGAPD